jgi:hypothetical protein
MTHAGPHVAEHRPFDTRRYLWLVFDSHLSGWVLEKQRADLRVYVQPLPATVRGAGAVGVHSGGVPALQWQEDQAADVGSQLALARRWRRTRGGRVELRRLHADKLRRVQRFLISVSVRRLL